MIWMENAVQTHGSAGDDLQPGHLHPWNGWARIICSCRGQKDFPGMASQKCFTHSVTLHEKWICCGHRFPTGYHVYFTRTVFSQILPLKRSSSCLDLRGQQPCVSRNLVQTWNAKASQISCQSSFSNSFCCQKFLQGLETLGSHLEHGGTFVSEHPGVPIDESLWARTLRKSFGAGKY